VEWLDKKMADFFAQKSVLDKLAEKIEEVLG
jgi:hypothetical protein